MYVLVVPTDAEPTVALEPATISAIPWPFRLTCCVAELLDKNPSSVTVPDCAADRSGSRNSVAPRSAKQRILWGWVIESLLRLLTASQSQDCLLHRQVQRLMCVTVSGSRETRK